MPAGAEPDHPDVVILPPLLYLGALVAGGLLQWLWPLPVHGAPGIRLIGLALIVGGAVLAIAGRRELQRHDTNVDPREPALRVVTSGPYRYTRNPLYLSITIILAGIGLAVNGLWILLALIPTLIVMSRGVIDREERYMERKFGDEYARYRRAVRRWI
jgi:protein-S-isoprenylcysteine O-methyltransferase Ste14